jgi:peptidoglycan/LPS O-acetylase OafA/YrhL
MTQTPQWPSPATRAVVCVALICYCGGIIALAGTPATTVDWAEWTAIVMASVAIVGLVAHATTIIELPGEQYAYLVSGWAGFSTLLLYAVDTNDPAAERIATVLLVLCGTIGSYGAYLNQTDIETLAGERG